MNNIGSPGEFVSDHINFTVGTGQEREITFEGTEQYVRSLYASFVGIGYSATCSIKPGKCSLSVKLVGEGGGNEDATQVGVEVELQINTVHKSIYEPPGPPGFGLTPAQLAQVQRAVNTATNSEKSVFEVAALLADMTAAQVTLFDLGVRKVEHRIIEQPILSRVTTAGGFYQFPSGAHNGVGSNYSEAAMLNELGVRLNFPLPVFTDPLDSDIYYGWVKRTPRYTQVVGHRVSESVSFEFGAWSVDLHPLH